MGIQMNLNNMIQDFLLKNCQAKNLSVAGRKLSQGQHVT